MFWNKKNKEVKQRIKELEIENRRLKSICDFRSTFDFEELHKLAFLTETATELIDIPLDDNIYNYVANKIREIHPDAMIAISHIDETTKLSTTKSFVGMQSLVEKVLNILGKHPNNNHYYMDNDFAISELKRNQLVKVAGGLYDLTFKQIPQVICYTLEKSLGINHIYAIGFNSNNILYGNAVLIMTNNSDITLDNKKIIEAFTYQASLVFQKKYAEDKIRDSESKYKLLVDNVQDVIYSVDIQGRLTSLNNSFEKVTGLKKLEWLGRSFLDLVHPDERERSLEEHCFLLKNGYLPSMEHRIIIADGGYMDGEFNVNAIIKDDKVIGSLGSARNVTERKQVENKLKESLKEKTVLLQEVHHRVKNNLQIISSLLNLQSNYYTDKPETRNIFTEIQNRINSMSIVHEQLYQTEKLNIITVESYIKKLINSISNSYMYLNRLIDFEYEIKVETIGIDKIIPFGLILNELYTNSLKYAFLDKKEGCVINIKLYYDEKGMLILNYKDNGKGLPDDIDIYEAKSLGLRLINVFAKQLNGDVVYKNDNGANFILKLK